MWQKYCFAYTWVWNFMILPLLVISLCHRVLRLQPRPRATASVNAAILPFLPNPSSFYLSVADFEYMSENNQPYFYIPSRGPLHRWSPVTPQAQYMCISNSVSFWRDRLIEEAHTSPENRGRAIWTGNFRMSGIQHGMEQCLISIKVHSNHPGPCINSDSVSLE